MNHVMDEFKVVNDILERDYFEHGYGVSVSCLTKHYKDSGLDKDETKKEILDLFEERGVEFEKPYLHSMLNDIVKSVYNGDKQLLKVDGIPITITEWETIRALENKDFEKLAFVLLVNAKAYGLLRNKDNIWYNGSRTALFKEAKLANKYSSLEKQMLLLRELYQIGMIEKSKSVKKFALKINYIKYEEQDIAFHVTEFDNILYHYRKETGENVAICKNCNKVFKKPKGHGKGNVSYCSEKCKEIAKKKQTRDRVKKNRQKNG